MVDRFTEDDVVVTLQVFSGRPDPQWKLAPEKVQELVARFTRARAVQAVHPPNASRLGYRGFSVRVGTNQLRARSVAAGLPVRFEVDSGVMSIRTPDESEHWLDSAEIERFLLEDALEHGFADLLAKARGPRK